METDYKKAAENDKKLHNFLHKFKQEVFSFYGISILIIITSVISFFLIYTCHPFEIIRLITLIIIFLSAVYGFDHLYHSKNRLMMEFLEDLNRNWDSIEMLLSRKCALSNCKDKGSFNDLIETVEFKLKIKSRELTNDKINTFTKDNDKYIEYAQSIVCTFFEELGYFLKRHAVDLYFVNEIYGAVIVKYHELLSDFIKNEKKTQDDAYENFDELYKAIKSIDKDKN